MSIFHTAADDVHRDQFNDAREAVAEGRASLVAYRPHVEHAAVREARAQWLGDRPSTLRLALVPCPRCNGLGLLQFVESDAVETEVCSSCEGTGDVDAATAATIYGLMDWAAAQADPDDWDDGATWVPTEAPDRLQRLFTERAEFHRHVDTSDDADWKAEQFEALLRLAVATDAADVATLVDRLGVLDRHFA